MTRADAVFDQFYERHYRQVLAYCLRRTGRHDADEAAAEVFAIAWRRRVDIPPRDRALPWLYGIARNVLSHQRRSVGRFRRLKARAQALAEPPPPRPDAVVIQRLEYRQVREALERLGPDDREVLRLAAWEGLTHREIADVIGCTHAAADKRVARAKKRLAREYDALSGIDTYRPPASAAGGGGSR